MTDYKQMNTSDLLDLLSQETEKLTRLMSVQNMAQEYELCKNKIRQIQAAIEGQRNSIAGAQSK